ncbi:MAG TPA: methylated-DNA--[protein]-cysteine S-methyltransferase [Ignavibacteria bacterium]|jgi:AraC family transcriptional regulator of adaptative response/methylated-DNA-[protein]-cysteine methyltransferase
MQIPTTREMRTAFYRGDSTYDGIFYVAVKTTNIFCRPSCRVKKPLEKNIEFFGSARDALFAGYRACKRCKPLEPAGSQPDWAKKLIGLVESSVDKRINDGELRKTGIDPARARRYFMKTYGMTFHAYQRSRRLASALTQIREGSKLDEVILGNGYESHSGFRDAFSKVFGKPPGRSKSSECIVTSLFESPLGPIILGAASKGLCLTEFTDRRMLEFQMKTLHKRFDAAIVPGKNEFIRQAEQELKEYFSGNLKKFKVPLIYPGTEFQQKVWGELIKIPYGETISYAELAKRVGIPDAVRAVGTANGMNRLGIIIPCHRVVNKSGKLGGYGGGVWRKQWLLDLERSNK